MPHFHIEGLHPYDGDYPFDFENLTNRDHHIIKEISGVRGNELEDAFQARDNDLIVAFCEIALRKAGVAVNRDALWDAPVGAIQLVADDEEEQESPPLAPPSEDDKPSEPAERPQDSGEGSAPIGDSQANGPSRTGSLSSDTGSASAPATLAR